MSELKQTMQRAREFIAANLAECCRDELDWQKSSILRDGKLREAAAIFGEVDKPHSIPMAQSETARQAMQLACRAQPEANADAKDAANAQEADSTLLDWLDGEDFVSLNQYIQVYATDGTPLEKPRKFLEVETESSMATFEGETARDAIRAAIDAARQAKESGNG